MATTSTGASSIADGSVEAPAPDTVSLSMSVKPGQPVPLELVKERSYAQLGARGYLGQGIDVALIDSGVTPVVGLDQPGKILYGPDLSNEGGLKNLANLDTFGHGTHMAGIIAGDDGDQVTGLAPESRIVSVKVAGATGETNVAQVIAAIDWVIEHKNDNGLNIRVLNLSLGLDGVKTSQGDPLSAAAERAWNAGIVVVAAVGNRGNDHGGIDSPALSPYVLAVGGMESYESQGTQDSIASWSSGGNDIRTPDVVAAGRSILSFRVPGSMLDQTYPTAIVGERYFVGSGTSQSAAVVSGFAAAMLSGNPALTSDQIKFLFMRSANDLVPGRILDGNGRINPTLAGRYLFALRRQHVQNFPLAIPQLGTDAISVPSGASWSGGTWNGASWSGGTWNGASWSGASWSGASWSGGVWHGASWSGASWSGASWSGASWSGASWSGASWSGASWSGASWSGLDWS
jgi:serine protease AprX